MQERGLVMLQQGKAPLFPVTSKSLGFLTDLWWAGTSTVQSMIQKDLWTASTLGVMGLVSGLDVNQAGPVNCCPKSMSIVLGHTCIEALSHTIVLQFSESRSPGL